VSFDPLLTAALTSIYSIRNISETEEILNNKYEGFEDIKGVY